jgi:branched-subunit amino acid transport protein
VSFWIVMVLGGAITFATRISFIAAEGRYAVPDWFRAMLPFVPIATLTAIVAPELARPGGGALDLSPSNARLVAGLAAIAIAAATRHVLLTIAGGFAVLWLLHGG